MRRRSISKQPIQTELFPFLSILACTIGTLILLIIVITSQMLNEQKDVKIVVKSEQGENRIKQPRYIECRADSVVIYPSKTVVKEQQISQKSSAFGRLLTEMKNNRDREYFIVAVRPDGFQVFEQVRELIESEGIDLGYEPFDSDWQLKIEEAQ
ncbi:hypothetical protein IQ249_15995 [Lusitaniella coriacea LEGE 07157]|uniref:Uncharacterized protein n=1 Tax=Lusitaniella coriacea LEGE 07157 TaxID=945747 RepID=A0A8J7DY61_9CYAN|nr:hypothetical protein [Lusitaniella coriacea]MBE9117402.1 hypothetical protein [Lusitaniella coriacea LEGE 07157]